MIKILERKQVGIIYHFTDFGGFAGMVSKDKLVMESNYDYISFTRDYDFPGRSGGEFKSEIRIAFYGDILSDLYHIEPFSFYGKRGGGETESEERINEESVIIPARIIAHVQFLWERNELLDYTLEEFDRFLIDNKIPYYANPNRWMNRVELQRAEPIIRID
jgi:hypothetical protein